jgi:hypothetical protein
MPSETGGATWSSGYTTSVSAAINAAATTIPTTRGGDVGRISIDSTRVRIDSQAHPCRTTT